MAIPFSSSSTYALTNNGIMKNEKQELLLQNTSKSKPAPVRHPGQPSHEVVFALPLRDDGNVYSGTVTFTASKPIEVEVTSHLFSKGEARFIAR